MDTQSTVLALVLTGWVAILSFAALKGWQGWLALKRRELDMAERRLSYSPDTTSYPAGANRIELANLKERVRKLETIAAGIDP